MDHGRSYNDHTVNEVNESKTISKENKQVQIQIQEENGEWKLEYKHEVEYVVTNDSGQHIVQYCQ